jgi:hypothetical protein
MLASRYPTRVSYRAPRISTHYHTSIHYHVHTSIHYHYYGGGGWYYPGYYVQGDNWVWLIVLVVIIAAVAGWLRYWLD